CMRTHPSSTLLSIVEEQFQNPNNLPRDPECSLVALGDETSVCLFILYLFLAQVPSPLSIFSLSLSLTLTHTHTHRERHRHTHTHTHTIRVTDCLCVCCSCPQGESLSFPASFRHI